MLRGRTTPYTRVRLRQLASFTVPPCCASVPGYGAVAGATGVRGGGEGTGAGAGWTTQFLAAAGIPDQSATFWPPMVSTVSSTAATTSSRTRRRDVDRAGRCDWLMGQL